MKVDSILGIFKFTVAMLQKQSAANESTIEKKHEKLASLRAKEEAIEQNIVELHEENRKAAKVTAKINELIGE